jgi:hypothetical protein
MKEILGMTIGEFGVVLVTLLASAVALFLGVLATLQTARLRKKEYTIRLLDELRQWALDLWNSHVPRSPSVSELIEFNKLGELGMKARVALEKGDIALRSASVLAEGSYIRQLAEKAFLRELGEVFKNIDTEVTALGYLGSLDAGTTYSVKPIDPDIVSVISMELESKKKTVEQLSNEHLELFRVRLGELLTKIADIKASLL